MSLDVNKTGALERAEFLMFVAQWYGLPGVLGDGGDDNGSIYTRGERRDYDDDCDGNYDGDEYGGGDDNNAGGNTVDGAAEPVSEKEGLLRAKQAAKQATLTVEAAALIAAEPGERLGVLGSVGIVNEEGDGAFKRRRARREAAAAETRAMQESSSRHSCSVPGCRCPCTWWSSSFCCAATSQQSMPQIWDSPFPAPSSPRPPTP